MSDDRPLHGIVYFCVAILLTAAVDANSKFFSAVLHPMQVVWGYFAASALFVGLAALARRMPADRVYRTGRAPLQILRAGLLMLTISTLFAGLKYMPIADVTAITFASPLFVAALSGLVLGERVGIHRWAAVLVGMMGVLIVIRPGGGVAQWAVLLPLISAFGFGAFQMATRRLASTEPTFVTLFYTAMGCAVMSSAAVLFFWTPLDWGQAAGLLCLGAMGAGAHFFFIRSFEEAEASLLAPFNYTKLIWVVALGYVLFGEVPAPHVLIGSAVIIASGLYVLMRERRVAAG
ncbi:MAG: DMT family transporter [Rhodospirillaceae bacterium]|nr:DMT family transporter [Rhodospirillaceae bacterium]MDD9918164.1 DMT family transporter [Rhodospirillaceae bacterium]MDD9926348.1 DMT family transporter [Rhodospirillaceae bacterium]